MKTIKILAIVAAVNVFGPRALPQVQRQKLLASDAEAFDAFGRSVAISGDWAAASSPFKSDQINGSGAVYVFQRIGSTWTQTQKLKANDASYGAEFGFAIAMAGNVLVIGAPQDLGVGATYVFELVGSTWTQTAKLRAQDADPGDFMGGRVATTGDRIVMAAQGDDQHGQDAGAAYVFDRVGSAWAQGAKLMGNDTVAFDALGDSVSLSGDRAIVGDYSKDGPGGSNQGAAYVFEKGTTSWTQRQKLVASDGATFDHFGNSVAILGTRAVIGASGHSHQSVGAGGAVYAFEYNVSTWVLTSEFWADDTASNDFLGALLVISPDHLIAYAGSAGNTGSAYDFRPSGSAWAQAGKLLARDAEWGDIFGTGLAIDGDTVIAGAPGVDDACTNDPSCQSGAAYIFQLAPTATQYGHCPSGAPCNNTDSHGGCRDSTGQGAILAACGSGSASTDDLQLEVTHCPPNKSTLLFMGGTQVNAPFADGIRVVGGGAPGIYRFGIVQSDASGMAMRGPGLVAQSQGFHANGRIQAGQVWNFQVWYRDLTGPCGHLTNYSNGVQVAFTP